MAEEENNEQAQSQAATEEAGGTENEATQTEQTEDWESKYKAQQAEMQKTTDELNRVKDTFDLVSPYVDWARMQEQPESSEDEEKPPSREELNRFYGTVENKLLIADFRLANPDLREYEDTLVSSFVGRLRRTNPRMPQDEVLEKAAEQTREFLKAEREKGKAEVEKKKTAAAETAGLGTASGASEKKEPSEGETNEQYIASRRASLAKKRGF